MSLNNARKAAPLVGDELPEAAVDKKDVLLVRMNERNKDRQNYFDVKLKQRSEQGLQLEDANYFSHTFAERVRDIETRIQKLIDAEAKKTSGGDAPPPSTLDLTRQFAKITVDIQELQRYLTTSTMFLPDFKIKASQAALKELTSTCDEARVRLVPKKKFGFSRKNAVAATLKPKLTAPSVDATEASLAQTRTARPVFTWTLSDRSDEHIVLVGDAVNGQDVTISNLRNCLIELQGHAGSVQITNAVDCTFLCGPIARSLFAEQLQNTTLALACQQLRLHSSTACRIYLHVTCRAIIEDCKRIEVSNYRYDYATIESDFQKAGLDKALNNYADVADFNWLSQDVASPNWSLIKDCATPNWSQLRSTFKEKSIDKVTAGGR